MRRAALLAVLALLAVSGTAQAATSLSLQRATRAANHYGARDIRLGSTSTFQVTTCNRRDQQRATCFINETGGWQVLTNWPISVGLSRDGRFIDVRRAEPIAPVPYRERA